MFIRLTEANEKKCKLLLNVANISVIQSGNSANTYIRMVAPAFDRDSRNKTDYYFVMETLEQIEGMLNPLDEVYKRAWDAYVEFSMAPDHTTFDCIRAVVDAALAEGKSK